jgi:SAM-dependent methyltransferase
MNTHQRINWFDSPAVAERYAKARLFFHPVAIEKVRTYLGADKIFPKALDVGCGTGLSTIALTAIAKQIVGIDDSQAMINVARQHEFVRYKTWSSELLPFADSEFSLLSLCQSVHWLNHEIFFDEARRVLQPDGYLFIYDNYFSEETLQSPWFQKYMAEFPPPKRTPFTIDLAKGFQLVWHQNFQNVVSLSLDSLIDFLCTQTNVIAAMNNGAEIHSVQQRLRQIIQPDWKGGEFAEFDFSGPIWLMQPQYS